MDKYEVNWSYGPVWEFKDCRTLTAAKKVAKFMAGVPGITECFIVSRDTLKVVSRYK